MLNKNITIKKSAIVMWTRETSGIPRKVNLSLCNNYRNYRCSGILQKITKLKSDIQQTID